MAICDIGHDEPMSRHGRRRSLRLTLAGATALAVVVPVACSVEPPLSDAAVITVDLTSSRTDLGSVEGGGDVIYGWNHLEGTGRVEPEGFATLLGPAGPVTVDMLGQVAYVDGSGPFDGFITFGFADGSTLAVSMQGRARAATDTSDASFRADLVVLGGTGRLAGASGTGRFDGSRTAVLGSPVEATLRLAVTTAP